MTGKYLFKADLEGADFEGENLQGAHLSAANLRGANLRNADLRGAALIDTDFRGADLTGADLRGAVLYQTQDVPSGVYLGTAAIFGEDTILPDGSHWSLGTDMSRFTEPAGEV
jgi:uncharacterized protein YjbI with pentapeptide repeats